MDVIQRRMIIECFRSPKIRRQYGFDGAKELAREIAGRLDRRLPTSQDNDENVKTIVSCLNGKPVSEDLEELVVEILKDIAIANFDIIKAWNKIEESSRHYIFKLLSPSVAKDKNEDNYIVSRESVRLPAPQFAPGSQRRFKRLLQSGAYQIYRRYKPKREKEENTEDRNEGEDAVICEVAYINVRSMTCVLVTSKKHIYKGSMFINHEKILFILFEREGSSGYGKHLRFMSTLLVEEVLEVYSGIMIKIGDTSRRPL